MVFFCEYISDDSVLLDGQKTDGGKLSDISVFITLSDGTTCMNPLMNPDGTLREQLVRYMLNSDGMISSIDTVKTGKNESKENSLCLSSEVTRRYYYSASSTLSTSTDAYVVMPEAKVFTIPNDSYSDTNRYEYKVNSNSLFVNQSDYEISIYDADDFGRTEMLILNQSGDSEQTLVDSSLMLVTNVGESITQDGDTCAIIEGMSGGSNIQLYVDEEYLSSSSSKLEDVKCGDVIRYTKGGSGMLTMLSIAWNMNEDVFGRNYTMYYSNNLMLFGKIVARDGAYLMVDVSENGDGSLPILYVCSASNANIYEYSRSKPNEASLANINDASVDDYIFLHMKNTRLSSAVIVHE